MSVNMKMLLTFLRRLSESSSTTKYAYTTTGSNTLFHKNFSENCKTLAAAIERSAHKGTATQKLVINSIARHVRNQSLLLAQDILDKTDVHTKSLIPKHVLDFILRNS